MTYSTTTNEDAYLRGRRDGFNLMRARADADAIIAESTNHINREIVNLLMMSATDEAVGAGEANYTKMKDALRRWCERAFKDIIGPDAHDIANL